MINMCGKRRAMDVSVMDGQRPQIKFEGRWRAPYMTARYGAALGVDSGMVSDVAQWAVCRAAGSVDRRR